MTQCEEEDMTTRLSFVPIIDESFSYIEAKDFAAPVSIVGALFWRRLLVGLVSHWLCSAFLLMLMLAMDLSQVFSRVMFSLFLLPCNSPRALKNPRKQPSVRK